MLQVLVGLGCLIGALIVFYPIGLITLGPDSRHEERLFFGAIVSGIIAVAGFLCYLLGCAIIH